MFTTEHFIWIGICILFIGLLTLLSVKLKFSFKTSALIMAAISFGSEMSKIFSHMEPVSASDPSKGMVIEAGALPLHLCSILIFAYFYLPFAKNEKLKNYLLSLIVPVSLIGSTLAIVMATSGTDFTTPHAYQCFIYHAGMIWFAVYLMITEQAELGLKAWCRNLLSLFSLSIIMIWINGMLQEYNTNFLYVVKPPAKGLPLLNLDNGWYVYFATLVILGFIGISLVHIPYIIKECREKKQADKGKA